VGNAQIRVFSKRTDGGPFCIGLLSAKLKYPQNLAGTAGIVWGRSTNNDNNEEPSYLRNCLSRNFDSIGIYSAIAERELAFTKLLNLNRHFSGSTDGLRGYQSAEMTFRYSMPECHRQSKRYPDRSPARVACWLLRLPA